MEKIRIGILGTSEIAFRRFLPALKKNEKFEYIGVASRDLKKTSQFIDEFGGLGFDGYDAMLECGDIDAVYIPLPPALHYEWGCKALAAGKHVLMEKPFTTSLKNTEELIAFAEKNSLALHENYMFRFHSQLEQIKEIVDRGDIGKVRLYRLAFGFPKRASNDFRYNKELGGGALLDCGGYTVNLAAMLLGETIEMKASKLNYEAGCEVDLYGSASFENKEGTVAQISFGMDNCYKCDLEIWGSTGNILANRIFTAPVGFEPEAILQTGNEKKVIRLKSDDTFLKSIEHFRGCIEDKKTRKENYAEISKQAVLMNGFLGREDK